MSAKKRGLGRGIGALIPQNQEEKKVRPIDMFFGTAQQSEPDEAADAQGTETLQAQQGQKEQQAAPQTQNMQSRNAEQSQKTEQPQTAQRVQNTQQAQNTEQAPGTEQTAAEKASDAGKRSGKNDDLVPVPGATFADIPLTLIVPNAKQPRTVFDEDELAELAQSIQAVGVLEPIIVRPIEDFDAYMATVRERDAALADDLAAGLDNMPRFELIMGERRWRAASLAQQETIPAIVRRTSDNDLLRDALLENLHRVQLNPLEEAAAYRQMMSDFGLTQEELSARIARSRPHIANTLRLLNLPPSVQQRLAAGVLSAGHARALLSLRDAQGMENLADRIVAEGLSVRQTEEAVSMALSGKDRTPKARLAQPFAPELNGIASNLADRFDTQVKITMGQKKGTIRIDFANMDDLARIMKLLG
ncbi:MAG: ParB/RepB/Spo0J family partition protein [Actinomycetaceae bacterium]|nr:ParB/RepB/Spo0J family partition protein [Actinomycetaceae bacterium]MDY6082445.1 ParB/RepB/Spo0J family partition protein [Actinomycetaceae bacterium]